MPTRTKPLRRRTPTRVPEPKFVAVGVGMVAGKEVSYVNHLLQLMIEELQLRNFAATTDTEVFQNYSMRWIRK